MAFDPDGEYGLRHRVRLGYFYLRSYQDVAAALGVPTLEVERFLKDPAYIPPPSVVALMVANIQALNTPEGLTTITQTGAGRALIWIEQPEFTAAFLQTLALPSFTTAYKFHYHALYASEEIRSSIVYDAASWTLLDAANDVTGNDLSLLTTVVFYVAS